MRARGEFIIGTNRRRLRRAGVRFRPRLVDFVHDDAAYLADRIANAEQSTTPPPATARLHPPT